MQLIDPKVAFLTVMGFLTVQVLCVPMVAADNLLSVQNTSASPGATGVMVPINLTVDQNLTLLRFDVTFPVALCAAIADRNGDTDVDGAVVGGDDTIAADKDIVVRRTTAVNESPQEEVFQCSSGKIPVAVFSLTGATVIPAGSASIFTIEFDLRANAPRESFTLNLENIQAKRGPLTVNVLPQSGDLSIVGICGDGVIDPGEQCDDGNVSNTDACLNTCVLALCGDGFVRTGVEQCDDGNTVSGDGCSV